MAITRTTRAQGRPVSRAQASHFAINREIANLVQGITHLRASIRQVRSQLPGVAANQPPSYTAEASHNLPAWNTPPGLWAKWQLQYAQLNGTSPTPDVQLVHLPERKVHQKDKVNGRPTFRFCRIAQTVVVDKNSAVTPQTAAGLLSRSLISLVDVATKRVLARRSSHVVMKRGALDSFFKPTELKKPKYEASLEKSTHASYPYAVPHLPLPFVEALQFAPAVEGKVINDQPELDLVYYRPYIPASIAVGMFEFLRQELFFYRVQYKINRGGVETMINTPRFTTVFGVDATSKFNADGELVDAKTGGRIEAGRYKCTPRPIPECLDELRRLTEGTTGETFNFCLVNYYADGQDSISYHSDDERFLGPNPAIASFSLGAKRDFLMKHKPIAPSQNTPAIEPKQLKLSLGSGDMVLMKGKTQAHWLHSIPKRAGQDARGGRINITFRKAMVKGGTENYYQYNVGKGGVYRWHPEQKKVMLRAQAESAPAEGARNGVEGGNAQQIR